MEVHNKIKETRINLHSSLAGTSDLTVRGYLLTSSMLRKQPGNASRVVISHTHGEQLLACEEVVVKALIDIIDKNLAGELANDNNLILETSRNNNLE